MTTTNFTVLIVDDDELILRALNRSLQRLLRQWQIVTLSEPGQITELLAAGLRPDVVLSDRLMPGIHGEEVLQRVQRYCPQAIRGILTADSSADLLLDDPALIHFYLAKPFTDEQLKQVFDCAERLNALQFSSAERAFLGRLSALPVLPQLYLQIETALQHDDFSLQTLADLIGHDAVISSRILQLANSAFLGFSRPTSNLMEALSRLGTDLVKAVVLALKTSQQYQHLLPLPLHQALTEQCFAQASFAKLLCAESHYSLQLQDEAFLITLLDCLGLIVEAIHQQQGQNADEDICHYSKVTAYLMNLWGFPPAWIQAALLPKSLAAAGSISGVVHWLASHQAKLINGNLEPAEQQILQSLGLEQPLQHLLQRLHQGA